MSCPSSFTLNKESKPGMAGSPWPRNEVCSCLTLASSGEGSADGCEDIVDIASQRLHGRDRCEGD